MSTTIIVDVFGGDNAPNEILKACVHAQKEFPVQIALTGNTLKIKEAASRLNLSQDIRQMDIIHADTIFDIHSPAQTIVKEGKTSSLAVGLSALKNGQGDAFVSAGSTGGLITGALLLVGRIEGIKRAAIAPLLPTATDRKLLLDAGANIECKPEYLKQFAIMGTTYMRCIKHIEFPRVGLLNVGTEDTKGRTLEKEAYQLLKQTANINFIGNIEAREIPEGKTDVIVCDGFSGNIALKMLEGMGILFMDAMKQWFCEPEFYHMDPDIIKSVIEFKHQMDYKAEGGAVLLGIDKPVIKAHGNSDHKAFFNAIRQAYLCSESNMIDKIKNNLSD